MKLKAILRAIWAITIELSALVILFYVINLSTNLASEASAHDTSHRNISFAAPQKPPPRVDFTERRLEGWGEWALAMVRRHLDSL